MRKNYKSSYATVTVEEGVNYREIADMMSEIGYKMNHSSARNYVLRVMRKFAEAIIDNWQLEVTEERIEKICKSPEFQAAICDLIKRIES